METNDITIDRTKCENLMTSLGTKVLLNGNELHGVIGVTTEIAVDNIPTVILKLRGNVHIVE